MSKPYDSFLSYAGEDSDLVRELAGALRARGLRVWYAETELRVGDSILESVNKGLSESASGILVLSKAYLSKGWPNYELDTLMRRRIENDLKIYPVWHGVAKEDIEKNHPGLAGIYSLDTRNGFRNVVSGLQAVLIPEPATIARTSPWEDPLHRFLQGEGEASLSDGGGVFTIWEAIVHFKLKDYPVRINRRTFSRDELIGYAYEALIGDLNDAQMASLWLIYEDVKKVLAEEGADLGLLAYQELPR